MKTNVLTFLVFVCFGLWIWVGESFSATSWQKPKTRRISEDANVDAPGADQYRAPFKATAKYPIEGKKYNTTCADIEPRAGIVMEHTQIGETWYEFQKNGSMGRMISVTNLGHRHVSWHWTNAVYPGTDRYVNANCESPANVWMGQTHASPLGTNAGYSNQTHLSDGTSVITCQFTAGTPIWYSALIIDDSPCGGVFTRNYDLPDYIIGAPTSNRMEWPKGMVQHDPVSGRDYIHVVGTEASPAGAVPLAVCYERCYLALNDTLICQAYESGSTKTYKLRPNVNGGASSSPIGLFDTSLEHHHCAGGFSGFEEGGGCLDEAGHLRKCRLR
ncbi:MAG: hypothetical protein WCE90_08870 [Candidatus Zixiibacteriota bacterium]